jgi:hypothetical protein
MHLPVKQIAILAGSVLAFAGPASAQTPVAIVEDIQPQRAGVGFMDYVEAGRTIDLGQNGKLILGYLKSCLRETVTGGTVTIGAEKSVVRGGTVGRERVECDGGRLLLTDQQAGKGAAIVFRKGNTSSAAAVQPSLRIFSLKPVIRTSASAGSATVERLDRPDSPVTVTLKNGIADFARRNSVLARGGLYRVSAGDRSRVVKVDDYAADGGPLISRLIAF